MSNNSKSKNIHSIGYSSRWDFVGGDKDISIFEELKFAKSIGFNIFGLNLDRTKNIDLSKSDLIKLRKIAESLDMRIIVRCPHHFNTALNTIELFDTVKKVIKIATLVGSDRIMIHPGHIISKLTLKLDESKELKGLNRKKCQKLFNISDSHIKELFASLIINLRKIVSMARIARIKVALENNGESYQFGSNILEYVTILKKVNGLYASVSTGHANINGNIILAYIKKCQNLIINLDLHDNNGIKDEHLPVGKGNIDFKKIFDLLHSNKDLTMLVDTYTNELVKNSYAGLMNVL